MIAVDEIHIRISRRAEKNGVARSASNEGVRSGIAGARVGFDFDDASGEKFAALTADEDFSEQVGGDGAGVAVVEGAGEGSQDVDSDSRKPLKVAAIGVADAPSMPMNGTDTIGPEPERKSKAKASPPPSEPNRRNPRAYSATR